MRLVPINKNDILTTDEINPLKGIKRVMEE